MANDVLVSFCIFGKDPEEIYYGGALQNLEEYTYKRPQWKLRFYIGRSIPDSLIRSLRSGLNTPEIIFMDDEEDQTATGWRFLSLREDHDYYLFRDVDSRISERELAAVGEWIESGHEFHAMRDHPYHNIPMLAGLWGVNGAGAARIRHKIPDKLTGDYYQVDQNFLTKTIWRSARRRLLVHTPKPFAWDKLSTVRDFTVNRYGEMFVGEGYYADGRPRHPEHRPFLMEYK
jgi:hypothetical protein